MPKSRLDSWDDARLARAVDEIDSELAPLIASRRVGPPDAVRAGYIAELSAERRLYVAELSARDRD